jgi:hypothetical protein
MKIAAILFDLGDTIMIEETEVRCSERYGISWNDCYPPDPQRADRPHWTVRDARTLLELVEKIDSV